jgi:SAM-dependent methyltransferase
MSNQNTDEIFVGSIPQIYETLLVPLLFESYAVELASRLQERPPTNLLELAAGTGVATRAIDRVLPETTAITATDLNIGMLDQAQARGTDREVIWRQADAMNLPFADNSFDTVICQFGVMFFPEKDRGFAEVRRVLAPGGKYIFLVWDQLKENEVAYSIESALADLFPDDPPRMLSRTPYGYFDHERIKGDISAGGISSLPDFTTVALRSRAESAAIPAMAYCQGTPLRGEIEARDPTGLDAATAAVELAIAQRFGRESLDTKIQAHLITLEM